jgi:hypothetical protein
MMSRLMLVMIAFVFVFFVAYYVVGRGAFECLTAEKIYRQQYGAEWKERYYADRHTTVEADRRKALLGVGGLTTMTVLCWLIYRQIAPRRGSGRRRSRRRGHRHLIPS